MARGKIKIKRIENSTNRQVTYSKRRNGLFKKANELSVLCDATVSIIMLSSTNRVHQFLSPGVSTKEIYDRYQQTLGVDIWESHYQKMQEELQQLMETNRGLQREIRQRMGDCLEDLSFSELLCLGQSVDNAANLIREHKIKVITNQIGTGKKKVRNVQEINKRYLQDLHNFTKEEPYHGLVDNGEYDQVLGCYDGRSNVLALRLQPCPPALHGGAGAGSGSGSGAGSCITTYTLL